MPRGGYRPGAGRKKKTPEVLDGGGGVSGQPGHQNELAPAEDPKAFLLSVMNNQNVDARLRVDAAKALLSAEKKKSEPQGKKGERADAAAKAVNGKFKPSAGPKVVNIR